MVNGLFPGIWTELVLNEQRSREPKAFQIWWKSRLSTSYKTYDIFEFEIEKCEVVESEH